MTSARLAIRRSRKAKRREVGREPEKFGRRVCGAAIARLPLGRRMAGSSSPSPDTAVGSAGTVDRQNPSGSQRRFAGARSPRRNPMSSSKWSGRSARSCSLARLHCHALTRLKPPARSRARQRQPSRKSPGSPKTVTAPLISRTCILFRQVGFGRPDRMSEPVRSATNGMAEVPSRVPEAGAGRNSLPPPGARSSASTRTIETADRALDLAARDADVREQIVVHLMQLAAGSLHPPFMCRGAAQPSENLHHGRNFLVFRGGATPRRRRARERKLGQSRRICVHRSGDARGIRNGRPRVAPSPVMR